MSDVEVDWKIYESNQVEIRNWLCERGNSGKDWVMNRRWIGCDDLGGWDYSVRFTDDRLAAEFILRWT